jgi:hypothetical protein
MGVNVGSEIIPPPHPPKRSKPAEKAAWKKSEVLKGLPLKFTKKLYHIFTTLASLNSKYFICFSE